MGTVITIWLVLGAIYYISLLLFRGMLLLPKAVFYIVCLPVMPFIVAYRNRKEQPKAAKAIYVLWGSLCSIMVFSYILNAYCS